MKKDNSALLGGILILLVGIVGLAIPLQFLKSQEQDLLWNVHMISFETKDASHSKKNIEIKEAEYKKILYSMENVSNTYYHEPMDGQINMAKALELSIQTMNTFFGRKELSMNSFINIKAVLQTNEENYKKKPQYSYWNIEMSNENEKINIWMNSVSGIILKMDVNFYKLSDINELDLDALLDNYVSYTGFHMNGKKEEYSNIYKTAYDKIYFGEHFDFAAGKYHCMSPEKLDKEYIKVIIGMQEKD